MSKPAKVEVNPSYWYNEDDISNLLKILAPNNVDVFAQTQFEHEDLLTDNFKKAIENAVETGRTQLIPIHLHGNHWAGAIVRMQDNDQIQVIYNDPLGEALEIQPNAIKLVTAVQSATTDANRTADIIDLQLHQQKNSNDCGPFTVSNLVQLASDNGLDGLDRQAIVRRRILATPANGSASEIRDQHAVILPRLEVGHVADKTPGTLEQNIEKDRKKNFLQDKKKLLELKDEISKLEKANDRSEQMIILTNIGKIAVSISRKQIDKNSIREKFSSSIQGKGRTNILYLDTLGLLTNLSEEQDISSETISDLGIISQNIDFVMTYNEKEEQKNKTNEEDRKNKPNISNLKNFIATFYMPQALNSMRKLTQDSSPISWNERIDRYYFARNFSILGELSRNIRNILPENSEVTKFFRDLNKIRDNLKKKAHKFLIADGNSRGKVTQDFFVKDETKLTTLKDSFKQIDENLSALQTSILQSPNNNLSQFENEVFLKKLPHELDILSEFVEIFKGEEFILKKKKKLEKEVKKGKKDLTKIQNDLTESQEEYGRFLEGIKEEYRLQFPAKDDLELVKTWVSEDTLNTAKEKKDPVKNEEKEKRTNFIKNCENFEEESKRLKSLINFQAKNAEEKLRHESAIEHSVGIIGESIRFLFEIDDETNFLGEFARRSLVENLEETRMVRNSLMHNGNTVADIVFNVAQNTTSWVPDIKAIGLVHEFITLMSREGDYLDREAARLGLTSDQMQMRMAMFVGASYVRLGKIDEAYDVLEDAKSIALSKEGKPEVEEIIKINNLLAAIERKSGINTIALDLIEESLRYVEEYPQYKFEEAQLLNNKAAIISEVGDNEEAKELYKKAMDQGFVPAAISLGQMLCEEKKYDEAIEIYREQFLKINPERDQRPFEFIMTLRGLYLAQSENGQHEKADKTFDYYEKFYRSNIPLFKENCGQGYKNVEAMILHDEGSNLYCNGHYNRAINRLENSLSLLDETGIRTSRDISHIHLNIANCYKYLASKFSRDDKENPELRRMAIQHYEAAINHSDHPQSIDIAHANAGLAEIRLRQGLIVTSEEHQKKANSIFTKHKGISSGYAEIMRSSLRIINPGQDTEVQHEYESFGDDHAFLQSLFPEVSDCIKSSDYRGALNTINFCLSYMKALNTINPVVAQLRFQKFACHSHLKEKTNAIDSYKSFEEFVENYPDCADYSHRNTANKIFCDNFNTSLQEELVSRVPDSIIRSTSSSSLIERSNSR